MQSLRYLFLVFLISVFFVFGLQQFVGSLLSKNVTDFYSTRNKVTFSALLLVLFFWGGKPWPYSGFFNYQILLTNLPYPSTFVGGLSLLGLAFNARHQHGHRYGYLIVLLIITTIALLTHPLTAQFLLIGFFAQIFAPTTGFASEGTTKKFFFGSLLKLAFIFLGAIALGALWPYYPLLELLKGAGKVYDIANGDMYFHLLTRTWPFILLSPIILWSLLRPHLRPLLIIFLLTACIYIWGYLTHRYSFGRIISYAILCIQVACAFTVFQFECWAKECQPKAFRTVQVAVLLGFIIVAFSPMQATLSRLLTVANSVRLGRTVSNQIIYKDYIFLSSKIKQDAIVFADIKTSWLIPTFGAKVVVADHALAFVDDAEQRRRDVEHFFQQQTSAHARALLLQKYQAQYLLLNKQRDAVWRQIYAEFSNAVPDGVLFENDKFALIKL